MKKILSALLILILTGSGAACSCKKKPAPYVGWQPPEFRKTDIDLVKNGATDFKIVIPLDASVDLFANDPMSADELKLFFRQATGVEIEIITDAALSYSPSAHIISIGNTTLLRQSGITAARDIGPSGYYLKILGNTLFIIGETEVGTLNGVYGFLEYNFGISFYGFGEYRVPHYDELKLFDFDYSERPTFDHRYTALSSHQTLFDDTMTIHRLKQSQISNWLDGFYAHSTVNFIVPISYKAEHPDWFANDKNEPGENEICFTSEGAFNKALETIKEYRNRYETSLTTNVSIGTMDNEVWCGCATCLKSYDLYGGGSAAAGRTATYVRFVNKIAAAMKEWEQANGRKELNYSVFGYWKSLTPPAVYNEKTKAYAATHESVIPLPNVIVRFAPIYSAFNRSFKDPVYNEETKKAIEGWTAVTKNFSFWTYCQNFIEPMVWFNDFFAFKENLQIIKDMGADEIYCEFSFDYVMSAFTMLRNYVYNKLLWNINLDPLTLAYDFIDNYYKGGAPYMKELFDLVNMRFQKIDEEMKAKNGQGLSTKWHANLEPLIMTDSYWPFDFLIQGERRINSALAEADKTEDGKLKETLNKRIRLEGLSVKYLMLEIHANRFTASEYKALIDEFERDCFLCNITQNGFNNGDISKSIARYRARLNLM